MPTDLKLRTSFTEKSDVVALHCGKQNAQFNQIFNI